jgi:hypothetical protein
VNHASEQTESTPDQSESTAEQVADSRALEVGARTGLVSFGVVHLLIAWIAVRVAWSGDGKSASAGGALKEMAAEPLGAAVVWITALGLAALTVWQVAEVIWGHQGDDGARLWSGRIRSTSRAVVYAVLAVTAGKVAVGSGGSSGSGSSQQSMTSHLMSVSLGRWLVAAVGVGVVVVAVLQARRGITTSFRDDLEPGATVGTAGRTIERLGQVGYVTKGVSLAIVGVLFAWAAITYEPKKAGGLDEALKTLKGQPLGPYLLTVVALGLAAFGAYCFAWARHLDD